MRQATMEQRIGGGKKMKVHIEKDIWIPSGIYCEGCPKQMVEEQGRRYCNEFGMWLICGNGEKRVKCQKCFAALQKELTGGNY